MPAHFPVVLADGPKRRASAVRPLLDAAGWPTLPFHGPLVGPALLLIDPEHPQRENLLRQESSTVRALLLPDDRALMATLEEAGLGLGLPGAEVASRIATLASELGSADDLEDLVRIVAAGARALTGAAAASVLLLDPDTQELVFWAVRGGAEAALKNARVPRGEGVSGWVVQHRLPALVNDVAADPRHRRIDDGTDFVVQNMLALPLFWRGDVLGVVEAINREGGFSEREAGSLSALLPHLGAALNHTRSALTLRATAEAAARRTHDLEGAVRERTRVIAKAKAEWEQTFDALDEPMAVLDDFVVRRANRAYATRAGRSVVQTPGATCYQLLGRQEPCAGCPRSSLRASGEVQLPGGRTAVVARHSLRDGGEVLRYRDVTVERALEAKLRESDRQAAVVQLAAGAAHEINNPIGFVKANLATLSGYLDDLAQLGSEVERGAALARATGAHEVQALLEKAAGALGGETVEDLVTDVTDLIRESEQGLKRVADIIKALKAMARDEHPGPRAFVDLGAVTDLALRDVRAVFPAARAQWLARDTCAARGSPVRLQHAVAALLTNAFQASRDAGTDEILLTAEAVGDEARLRIVDRGRGIAPEVRPKVFEPFFTTRGVGGGVGLGLTAAVGIVARDGGRVELNPDSGGGTEAMIVLPLASSEEFLATGMEAT